MGKEENQHQVSLFAHRPWKSLPRFPHSHSSDSETLTHSQKGAQTAQPPSSFRLIPRLEYAAGMREYFNASHQFFRDWLSAHCLSRYPERLLVMLSAYFDESGDPGKHGFLTVAGYISNVERWELWLLWRERFTHEHQISPSDGKELYRCVCSMPVDEGRSKAAQAILNHTLRGFSVSIRQDQYAELTSPRFRSLKGSAYTLCTQKCIEMAINWAEKNRPDPTEPIEFVFDRGHRNQDQARFEMEKIRRTSIGKRRLRDTFAFADDATIIQLQTAHILAYETTRKWHRQPHPILELVGDPTTKHVRYHFNRERIVTLFSAHERLRQKRWKKR